MTKYYIKYERAFGNWNYCAYRKTWYGGDFVVGTIAETQEECERLLKKIIFSRNTVKKFEEDKTRIVKYLDL
jgi:hypothetical protein